LNSRRLLHLANPSLFLLLADSLAFYGQYHNNRWNQLIHFIFVPAIMATLLMFLLLAYNHPLLPAQPLQSAFHSIHVPATLAQ
jgi:uncharacterized membrane protein YGL010W